MPSLQKDARLFGLDLAPLGRDVLTAWRAMLEWPVVALLWPQPQLRLWLPGGQKARSRGPQTASVSETDPSTIPHFQAMVLPEDILLRRTWIMPTLAQAELKTALALQLESYNPFPPEDLVWTSETQATEDGKTQQIHTALTSRKLIGAHWSQQTTDIALDDMEVWVPHVQNGLYAVAAGFAEKRRLRRSAHWRWFSASLLLLSLILVVAILATPSAQLYLRSKQAEASLDALQKKALPVLAERERFTQATDRLQKAVEPFNQSAAPLPVLQLITEVLGDDTALLSLQVQGHKVIISGQTVNASALMKKLGSQPGLRDVRAPAPATKPLGATRESFTIEFTMDPEQWPSMPVVTELTGSPAQGQGQGQGQGQTPVASVPVSQAKPAPATAQTTPAPPSASSLAAPDKPAAKGKQAPAVLPVAPSKTP